MSIKRSDLASGMGFKALIKEKEVEGKIWIIDAHLGGGKVYLLQDTICGEESPHKLGYRYSWYVPMSGGEVFPENEEVREFQITDTTRWVPSRLDAALTPSGASVAIQFANLLAVNGVLHSTGTRMFLCHNDPHRIGNISPDLHGFNYSYELLPDQDGYYFTIPHVQKLVQFTPPIEWIKGGKQIFYKGLQLLDNWQNKEKELRLARVEGLAYHNECSRPTIGFGYDIYYSGNNIRFGCGEIEVTKDEVVGFLKIMKGLKRRDILTGSEVDDAITLSERLTADYKRKS